jgi:hypothetical protein
MRSPLFKLALALALTIFAPQALLAEHLEPLESEEAKGFTLIDAVAARINDEIITLSDLKAEIYLLGLKKDSTPPLPRVALRDMVKRRLLVAQADKLRIKVSKKEIKESVDELLRNALTQETFWAKLDSFGLGPIDIDNRFTQIAKALKLISIRKRSTYISESVVRKFWSDNPKVFGKKSFFIVRNEIRDHLAKKKHQKDLNNWIEEQMIHGRVRIEPINM